MSHFIKQKINIQEKDCHIHEHICSRYNSWILLASCLRKINSSIVKAQSEEPP